MSKVYLKILTVLNCKKFFSLFFKDNNNLKLITQKYSTFFFEKEKKEYVLNPVYLIF